jgi:hypothetical protein
LILTVNSLCNKQGRKPSVRFVEKTGRRTIRDSLAEGSPLFGT